MCNCLGFTTSHRAYVIEGSPLFNISIDLAFTIWGRCAQKFLNHSISSRFLGQIFWRGYPEMIFGLALFVNIYIKCSNALGKGFHNFSFCWTTLRQWRWRRTDSDPLCVFLSDVAFLYLTGGVIPARWYISSTEICDGQSIIGLFTDDVRLFATSSPSCPR